jgi:hypothetical protein
MSLGLVALLTCALGASAGAPPPATSGPAEAPTAGDSPPVTPSDTTSHDDAPQEDVSAASEPVPQDDDEDAEGASQEEATATTEAVPEDEQPPLPDDEAATATSAPSDYAWGGIIIPTINYNSTDGLGFGAGAQVFDRARGQSFGYRYRLTLSTFWTTTGNYTSNYAQLERQARHTWLTRLTYQRWRDLVYVGHGGADVSVRNGEEARGNYLETVTGFVNVRRSVRNTPLHFYAQAYARWARVEAADGGPLDQDSPLGIDGGFYFDAGGGAYVNEVDRWPVPRKGVQSEIGFRAGGTASPEGFDPLVGVRGELMAWYPIVGDWLVIGGRTVLDKTFGRRPFFEQEFLSGQERDEVAYEQMLTGYGRTRTRGDGVFATMFQVRSKIAHGRSGFFDLALYAGAYVETAFLFEGNKLGPHMPSVGICPTLLWQGGVVVRPFLAWGWFSDEPGGARTPSSQFGVSLMSPM